MFTTILRARCERSRTSPAALAAITAKATRTGTPGDGVASRHSSSAWIFAHFHFRCGGTLHSSTEPLESGTARVRPISEVLRTAKAVDPDMAAVRDKIEGYRHRYMHTIAEWLADRGPLLVTLDRAADIIWTLASPDVARMLCDQRGWTTEDYAEWLEETLAATLLPRPALHRGRPR